MYYRHQRGQQSEAWALDYLSTRGLKLIATNFTCRGGEIDLIMAAKSAIQANILVFVEVRYRRSNKFGGAAASVDRGKQRRLRRAAEFFLKTHPTYLQWPCRFDVIAISGLPDKLQITWLQSAFEC